MLSRTFIFIVLTSLAWSFPSELRDLEDADGSHLFHPDGNTRHGRFTVRKDIERDREFWRLPNTTVPQEYNLTLNLDPDKLSFTGETRIKIRAVEDTNTVVLHAYGLVFDTVTLTSLSSGARFNLTYEIPDDGREFLIITLRDGNLTRGQDYELAFEYEAYYTTYLAGLYRSYYTQNGTRRYQVVSQFQSVYAKDAFPCYDEPGLKAEFYVTIFTPPGFNAVANMDLVELSVLPESNYTKHSFRKTPLMSTYLLAIVVSDFDYLSNIKDGPILYPKEYNIRAKPEVKDRLRFALEFGQKSLGDLQKYTDVSYRLPKVDNVGLPQFDAGAMENWGLVTYRERLLLNNVIVPDTSTLSTAFVMSHENAHFWFGNEVSPEWWDYLWLNEGFATFFEYFTTDRVLDGEFQLMERFVLNVVHPVMERDATTRTNPMSNVVDSPEEIENNFNFVAYSKSGSVVRMMQHILGEERFRIILSNYIKSLPLGLSNPTKLYNSIQSGTSGTNLLPDSVTAHEVFSTWSEQAGYPILEINRIGADLTLSQERYFQSNTPPDQSKWWIPLTWTTSSNSSFEVTTATDWLSPMDNNKTISINQSADWYIFNLQNMGYFRVMYDQNNWDRLKVALNSTPALHPLNKAQLIDDADAFCRKGIFDCDWVFDYLNHLQTEDNYIPWQAATDIFYNLNKILNTKEYSTFIKTITSNRLNSLGLSAKTSDSHNTKMLRKVIANIACEAKVDKCLEDSYIAVSKEIKDKNSKIQGDLQQIIYCAAVRKGDVSTWLYMMKKYINSDDDQEKLNAIVAMSCSEDIKIIDLYLSMTLSPYTVISKADKVNVVKSVITASQLGLGRTLLFIRNNLSELKSNIDSPLGISTIIKYLGETIVNQIDTERFYDILKTYETSLNTLERSGAEEALLKLAENRIYINRYSESFKRWFEEFK